MLLPIFFLEISRQVKHKKRGKREESQEICHIKRGKKIGKRRGGGGIRRKKNARKDILTFTAEVHSRKKEIWDSML